VKLHVIIFALALTGKCFAQDAVERSNLQAQDEGALQRISFMATSAVSTLAASVCRAQSEKVIELAHRFQVTPWSYFQSDIQYVIDPIGTGDIPDAVVIGA
jgi:carbohydrate-selective porin OprB